MGVDIFRQKGQGKQYNYFRGEANISIYLSYRSQMVGNKLSKYYPKPPPHPQPHHPSPPPSCPYLNHLPLPVAPLIDCQMVRLQYLQDKLRPTMKWILPMNEPFKNLREFASAEGDSLAINTNSSHEKGGPGCTGTDENQVDSLADFQRFQKRGEGKWQISFEKYFLTQHTTTFKKQLQNFEEYGLPIAHLEKARSSHNDRGNPSSPQSPPTLMQLLREECIPLAPMHLRDFSAALPRLDDLQKFLSHVLGQSNYLLAIELVALSIQIWLQFRNTDFKFVERKELLEKSRTWVDTHSSHCYSREDFSHLNLRTGGLGQSNRCPQPPKHFVQFLRYFSTTVLLILAGYFQNPYSDENFDFEYETLVGYPKRSYPLGGLGFWSNDSDFSDFEESCHSQKRLKES